jgi:hypothetical protein
MALKTIKLDDVEYVRADAVANLLKKQVKVKPTEQDHPYVVGRLLHVETATKYYLGTCTCVTDGELILGDAAWIPNTGRAHKYFAGGAPEEMEPLNGPVFISRGAIVAVVPINHSIEIMVR